MPKGLKRGAPMTIQVGDPSSANIRDRDRCLHPVLPQRMYLREGCVYGRTIRLTDLTDRRGWQAHDRNFLAWGPRNGAAGRLAATAASRPRGCAPVTPPRLALSSDMVALQTGVQRPRVRKRGSRMRRGGAALPRGACNAQRNGTHAHYAIYLSGGRLTAARCAADVA